MTYEEAKMRCHVRSAIHRTSNPSVKYWKNHPVPIDDRVPETDKLATDWKEHDPRIAPEEHEWVHYDEQIEYSQRCILALIEKETGHE